MRRRRNPGRRPGLEALPRRALLSGAGVNMYANYDWRADAVWTDVQRLMGTWTTPSNTVPPVTSHDYPLVPATAGANLALYPNGVYQVSYKGTASVFFSGIGVISEPMTKGADGVTRGTVVVASSNNPGGDRNLWMTVTSTSASDPMDDLHIWTPGAPTDGSKLFTDAILNSVRPFDYIRYMDWNATNNSTISTWSQRPTPGAFGIWNISYEEMIALSNESGDDMWITIPALADDDYVKNLAALIHRELDPGLNVYVEYSNETWNGVFGQYGQVLAMANADYRVSATTDWAKIAQESALQIKRISDIFRGEFGDDFSRVLPVFSGFTLIPDFLTQGLSAVDRWYGAPSQYIKSTAVYGYVDGYDAWSSNASSTMISGVYQSIANITPYLSASVAAAAAYGLPLDMYEGGIHFINSSMDAMEAAWTDPLVYDAAVQLMSSWKAVGGRNATFYTLDDPAWGLKANANWAGSHTYDGILSSILKPGDANGDGEVDFADFQVVAANVGRDQLWWSQGDFNHDGKVDVKDLSTLLSNLDASSLTADQATQIAVALKPTSVTATTSVSFQVFGEQSASSSTYTSASNSANKPEPTLTWTVTKNGASYASATGPSFVLSPSGDGTYVVFVRAVDAAGATSTRSVSISVGAPSPQATASYLSPGMGLGTWQGTYGHEASLVAGDVGNYPSSSAYISVSGATTRVYDRATTDARALQKLMSASYYIPSTLPSYSIASGWAGSSFTIDVNLTDGEFHKVSLYALDWDSSSRAESIEVVDAATGQVLDTRSISSFTGGTYQSWTVSGHVQFRITRTAGADAMISGVFVDPATDALPPIDETSDAYVSDLAWVSSTNGWGPAERDMSVGGQGQGDGPPIRMAGKTYAKGLGTHAGSDVTLALDGRYSRFQALVGIDDDAQGNGSVVFQVWADGVKLFDSGVVRGGAPPQWIDVDVSGKSTLRLVATDAGDGFYYDHADWADARLTTAAPGGGQPDPGGGQPDPGGSYVSDLAWVSSTNGWGPAERDMSVGGQGQGDGPPIRMAGKTYAKGLGTHAGSDVTLALDGRYSRFQALVGIDDDALGNGSVVFQVWADGVKLFDSGVMTGMTAPKAIDVDVAGRSTLRLVATDAGDGFYYDHADWADARLTTAAPGGGQPDPGGGQPDPGGSYVSDLAWVSSTNGWGPAERDMSVGGQGQGDGPPIRMAGKTYAKGLGTHAGSDVTLALDGRYSRFQALVGIDDDALGNGSVVFQVWADGVKLFDSGVVRGGAPPQWIDVDVSGKSTLRLVVTDAGDGFYYDHADWADARLTPATATGSSFVGTNATSQANSLAVYSSENPSAVSSTTSPSSTATTIDGAAVTYNNGSSTSDALTLQTSDGVVPKSSALDPSDDAIVVDADPTDARTASRSTYLTAAGTLAKKSSASIVQRPDEVTAGAQPRRYRVGNPFSKRSLTT